MDRKVMRLTRNGAQVHRFKAGMTATFSAILYTPHFIRLQVFGSKRWVEVINSTHPDTPGGTVDLTICETNGKPVKERFDWTDTVRANIEAFADAIEGRTEYPFTHEELVHNIEVLEAIVKSADDLSVERFD